MNDRAQMLISQARGCSDASRLEALLGEVVALGAKSLKALAALRDDAELSGFAIAALERMGRTDTTDAILVLRDFVAKARDPDVKVEAKRALGHCLNPVAAPSPAFSTTFWRPSVEGVRSRPPLRESIWGENPSGSNRERVIVKINAARRARRQAILDEAEALKVLENLDKRAADPAHYRKWCWHCLAVVDEGTNEHCRECRWLVCWCGACRAPEYVDTLGQRGACRTGAWTLGIAADLPDRDYLGRPILTSAPPSVDSARIREISARLGVGAVYHWSPARAIPSVLTHGLVAHPGLRRLSIDWVGHFYGSREKEEALGAYVATSLQPKRRMMDEWSREPVIWEIDPEVLVTTGTLFAPDNTARATLGLGEILAARGAAAYQIAVTAYRERAAQAELLVPERIPRMAIRRVHIRDAHLVAELRRAAQSVAWAPSQDRDWIVVGDQEG